MLSYCDDNTFKIEHSQVINKVPFKRAQCGAHGSIAIAEVDYTDTDANTIYCSDTTGDDANAGTIAAPKKTLLASMNACTATKTKVVVLDSVLYAEELDDFDNALFEGFYADTGQTPSYTLRVLDYTPADANTIFVAKTGDDGDAGTEAAPKLTIAGAIAAVDGTHQAVCILDSETYQETGFNFTGNFKKLVAALGENPTIDINKISNALHKYPFSRNAAIHDSAVTYFLYDVCELLNGDILLCYYDTVGLTGYYKIVDENGVTVKSLAQITSVQCSWCRVDVLSSGNVVYAYISGADGKIKLRVFEPYANTQVVAATDTGKTPSAACLDIAVDDSDNINVIYTQGVGGSEKIYLVVYDSALSLVKAGFKLSDTNPVTQHFCDYIGNDRLGITIRENGNVSIILAETATYTFVNEYSGIASAGDYYWHPKIVRLKNDYMDYNVVIVSIAHAVDGASSVYKLYKITDAACTQLGSDDNEATASGYYLLGIHIRSNGDIIYTNCYDTGGGVYYGYFKILKPEFDYIKVSTDAVINGIKYIQSQQYYLLNYIECVSASLDMSWCEIDDISPINDIDSYAIYSDDDVNINNCDFHDGDYGIYMESSAATIEKSLFYRFILGESLHIKGNGSSIIIRHNTFYQNYTAIELEDNDGDEVIKNNIIHDNNVYGIYAEVSVNQTYSVNTDVNVNVVDGASVVNSNPLFVNEGDYDPDDTDLTLRLTIFGYPFDSPAYLLADDTTPDIDAGGWNITPVGESSTWTSFTMQKPSTGIKVYYDPIGATKNVKKDGTIDTKYEAWQETIEFDFSALRTADFTSVLAMIMSGDNVVRLYPDPVTHPNDYNTYVIVYEKINGGVPQYRLSRTGVEKPGFKLVRAYELT